MAPIQPHTTARPRLACALAALGAAALALLIAVFHYEPVSDQDFWWHLKGGWYILAHHAVPRTNTFSYGASDAPWIDLHWLYQVVVFALWQRVGPGGIMALKVAVGFITWVILTGISAPRGRFLAILPFLALGAIASNERMTDRPELFSYLFLAIQTAILLRYRRRPSGGLLFALVGVQILWANFHALSMIGTCLVGAFVVGESVTAFLARRGILLQERHPLATRDLRRLALAGAGCVAALTVTPYGLDGATFPFKLFGQLNNPHISMAELMSPFSAFRPTIAIHTFRLLTVAVAAVILLSLPRVDLSLLLAALGFFALAITARRNIPLFVLSALPLVGAQIEVVVRRLGRIPLPFPARRSLGTISSLLVIAGIGFLAREAVDGRLYKRDQVVKSFGGGIAEGLIPRAAMDYVIHVGLEGNAFNDIDAGGYFLWRGYPKRRAFIDARLEAAPLALFEAYSRAFYSDTGWRALDGRYRFDYAVLSHRESVNLRLINRLLADPAWALVHVDPVAVVFVRRATVPHALIERDEIAPEKNAPPPFAESPPPPDPIGHVVRTLLRVREKPDPAAALAYAAILVRLGFFAQAIAPADRALAEDPASAYAHMVRGAIADATGDLPGARRAFEHAVRLDPSSAEAAFNLGSTLLRTGELANAAAAFDRALALNPRLPRAHHLRGVAMLARGDAAGAQVSLRRAISLDPGLADAYYYFGIASRRLGQPDREILFLKRFLAIAGGSPELRADAARLLETSR